MPDIIKKILETEFSNDFIDKMKNRMIISYFKYGKVKDNYGKIHVNAVENLKKRLEKYEETGNTEWLVDAANFAMIEFMYPQHENAHFKATDSRESPGLIIKVMKAEGEI
jgi:hypothetical protein